MEDLLIDIIYDLIKDYNFYNYNNDERLKNIEIEEITNILGDKVINITLGNKVAYTLNLITSYRPNIKEE